MRTLLVTVIVVVLLLTACGGQSKKVVGFSPPSVSSDSQLDVNQELLQMLKKEFREERERIASDLFGADQVIDLHCEEGVLGWSYFNSGDYDQDGEVAIPDITLIAQRYLHRQVDGVWPDELDEVIDGDRNGEIGISDITPIAVNYLRTVVGYSIQGTDEVDGEFTELARIELPTGSFNSRITFTHPVFSGVMAKAYLRVVPINREGNQGTVSNTVTNPPIIISVTPDIAIAGTNAVFTINTVGALPERYNWNFGEAVFPKTTIIGGLHHMQVFGTNDVPGQYPAHVDVGSNIGQSTLDFTLTLREGEWVSKELPMQSNRPAQSAITADGGLFVVYYDSNIGDGSLMAIKALDFTGDTWSDPVVITTEDAYVSSVEIIDGNPAITYFEFGSGDPALKFIRALNSEGTLWPEGEIIEAGNNYYASLGEVADTKLPCVVYIDATGKLKFSKSNGDTWTYQVIPADVSKHDGLVSLLCTNEKIMVAYNGEPPDYTGLRLIMSEDGGNEWGEPIILDSSGGFRPCLRLGSDENENTHLIVSYIGTGETLRCVLSDDITGADWNLPLVVDTPDCPITGQSMITEVAGRPAIAYSLSSGEIRYVRALNSAIWGEDWKEPVTASFGLRSSMQFVGGVPVILHSAAESHRLHLARLQ